MPGSEVLLVGATASVAMSGGWSVVSRAGPEVVVLRANPDDFPQLARGARFAISRSSDGSVRTLGDENALNALDPGTRLFVQAWRDKQTSKPERPGEGLPWDAPGFQSPDQPAPRKR